MACSALAGSTRCVEADRSFRCRKKSSRLAKCSKSAQVHDFMAWLFEQYASLSDCKMRLCSGRLSPLVFPSCRSQISQQQMTSRPEVQADVAKFRKSLVLQSCNGACQKRQCSKSNWFEPYLSLALSMLARSTTLDTTTVRRRNVRNVPCVGTALGEKAGVADWMAASLSSARDLLQERKLKRSWICWNDQRISFVNN